jgi:hypothetical protein
MSEKTPSISEGLAIENGFFEQVSEIIKQNLIKYDTISDALEATALEVRGEELGEVPHKISKYEKKLILSGFIMGCVRTSAEVSHKLLELKGEEGKGIESGSVSITKGSDGKPSIVKGALPKALVEIMLQDPDCPDELKEMLRQMYDAGDFD